MSGAIRGSWCPYAGSGFVPLQASESESLGTATSPSLTSGSDPERTTSIGVRSWMELIKQSDYSTLHFI